MVLPIEHFSDSLCFYCSEVIKGEEWKSMWLGEFHYKVGQCSCGKESRIEIDFDGSGHDCENPQSLDSTIKVVWDNKR